MILGFVSDAHGNPEGLEGCLRVLELEGATRIYFLGDAVGYLPEENAVLHLLRSSGAICVRGNHEAMLLGEIPVREGRREAYRLEEAGARLEPAHRDWIAAWPVRLELEIERVRLLLVHGSPADPLEGYVYPDTDLAPLRDLPFDVALMGHTHRPFIATAGALTVVNPGSCGMPRDVGNLASCAIYDTATHSAEILRVPFDAAGLVARWGNRIDRSAADCLQRSAPSPVVGRIVEA